MQPDVSLIIPCFNQARFIPELFRSIELSTGRLVEIILIDDGSTNDDVLIELRKLQPTPAARALIVRRTMNCGLAASRNLGLDLCSGKYVKFLDADDLLLPGSLDLQISELENHPDAEIHLVDYCLGSNDLSSFSWPEETTLPTKQLTTTYVASSWETHLSIPIHCALFRFNAIQEIRFRETLEAKEDWLFWHALAEKQLRFIANPRVGVVYRTHSESMTRNRSRMARFWLTALDLIMESETHLGIEEDRLITTHFNRFYLPSVNYGFFEEEFQTLLDTARVSIPLHMEEHR